MRSPRSDSDRSLGLSNLWQVPTIAVALVLVIIGVVYALQQASERDIDAAIADVRRLIADDAHDSAEARIIERVEPVLAEASPEQRAAYHVTMAELAHARRQSLAPDARAALINEHYGKAVALGGGLDATGRERWLQALLVSGDLDGVCRRLSEMEAIEPGTRQSVLDRLVNAALDEVEPPFELLQELLRDFRGRTVGAHKEAWAVAQEGRLRLIAGDPGSAIDHLLLEMRRLEASEARGTVSFAEMFLLLGRAYYEIGRLDDAEINLERAVARYGSHARGLAEARLLIGHIALARDEDETALEAFDHVVVGAPSRRTLNAALLGRAEVRTSLGDFDEAAADDNRLLDAAARGQVSTAEAATIVESLLRRHDDALIGGDVPRALTLAQRVERISQTAAPPPSVVLHLAASRHAIAAQLSGDDPRNAPPVARAQYSAAAEMYLEHARMLRPAPDQERAWADSLWRAGDSYDLGGDVESAIAVFREYIAGRGDEPRRAEALFRLAECSRSVDDAERALDALLRLREEHPRSPYATRAHVPLARCYVDLGRRGEAIQHLESVLRGQQALTPDAVDYRDALIELGAVFHESGDYIAAIGRLAEAAERYADDPRLDDIVFRLADSYRARADALTDRLERPLALVGPDRARWEKLRTEHLERASSLFGDVVHRLDEPGRALTEGEQQIRRLCLLYRADCAYRLERFDEAITLYESVAREYVDHHSSIFALVQIVNCHHRRGDAGAAAAAHTRALARLEQLPTAVFDDQEALFDREAWRRWLESSPPPRAAMLHAAASN